MTIHVDSIRKLVKNSVMDAKSSFRDPQAGARRDEASTRVLTGRRPGRKPTLALLLLLWTVLFALPAGHAQTTVVTSTGDSGPGSLRAALTAATNGTVVTFDPGLNGQTIQLTSGQLVVNKNLTISGPGASLLAIDGGAADSVIYLSPHRTNIITGLTITNGNALSDMGGGIYNDNGMLSVSNCTISGNAVDIDDFGGGGAVYNNGTGGGAKLILANCTITGNSAFYGGGVLNDGEYGGAATLTLVNCTVSNNSSFNNGGGIYNDCEQGSGTMSVAGSTLSGNSSGVGAAAFNDGTSSGNATMTLANCTLSGNPAVYQGGGIYNNAAQGTGTVTVVNCTLSGNSATNNGGGGIYNNGSQGDALLILSNSIVYGSPAKVADIFNDVGGVLLRQGSNIVLYLRDNTGGTDSGPAALAVNPVLAPLGNYGGPTQTMPPMPGSPALGTCLLGCGLTNDQRGFPRPEYDNGDGIPVADIGAVEGVYNPAGPGVLTGLSFPRPGWNRFEFTTYNGSGPYTVFATTNLALPFSAWSNLGTNVIVSPLNSIEFIFNDTQATNLPFRFYRVVSPGVSIPLGF